MFTLKGKTALVTGSGRGIGRAIAAQLASAGARVMINDLDEEALRETECALRTQGQEIAHCSGDLTAAAFPAKLVNETVSTFGGLDIVVNNAGYS